MAAPSPPAWSVHPFVAAAPRASWGLRVAGTLIELAGTIAVMLLVRWAVGSISPTAGLVGYAAVGLALTVWFGWQNGVSGQSPGKALLGMQTVSERTAQPPGGPVGLVRLLLAWAIPTLTCGLGSAFDYLWPLGDPERQTLHDKAVSTVVLRDRGRRPWGELLRP